MAIRVSEHHILFRLPLNAAQDVDRLIFFYGLEAFGVVGPFLGSRRPMFTRQAFYPFAELPKALYLFVFSERYRQASPEELRSYLLSHADAYLFTWNQQHPESRLNARGVAPIYEEEREGGYIHCDAGHTWVHDPLRCDMIQKVEQGPHWSTTEEISSGRNLFEHHFNVYERSVETLNDNWAIANDDFNFVKNQVRMVSKSCYQTKEAAQAHADWLLNHVLKDSSGLETITNHDETYIYEPVRMDRSQVLTYREVRQLENNLLNIAYKVEQVGIKNVMEDPIHRKLCVALDCQMKELSDKVVPADTIYPELPMAYFIAGLNGDRPYAQALGYYQVLEFTARQMNRREDQIGGDESALKCLLNDKHRLPDSTLKAIYSVAIADGADALGLRRPSGRFNRNGIAEKIYKHLRNPTVHAGESRGTSADSVHPYAQEQFTPIFQQTVRLTRELARHFVGLPQPTR